MVGQSIHRQTFGLHLILRRGQRSSSNSTHTVRMVGFFADTMVDTRSEKSGGFAAECTHPAAEPFAVDFSASVVPSSVAVATVDIVAVTNANLR